MIWIKIKFIQLHYSDIYFKKKDLTKIAQLLTLFLIHEFIMYYWIYRERKLILRKYKYIYNVYMCKIVREINVRILFGIATYNKTRLITNKNERCTKLNSDPFILKSLKE